MVKADFDALMAQLGPFGAKPQIAIGVSGGADSTALALLAEGWVAERGGTMVALIIDHGLRHNSEAEANLTQQRLATRGIAAQVIKLSGLGRVKLQETARQARHAALSLAARKAGAIFLMLGHHAADQSETVAMRAKRGNSGLEGMACWAARNDVVLLRPLLIIKPERLREFLRLQEMPWVEDPSNHDQRFERARVRLTGTAATANNPTERQQRETQAALFLAHHTIIRPEGFAIILANSAPPAALGSLLRMIGGAQHPPRQEAVAALAGKLRPATLGGVRVLKAGKLGPGWLVTREFVACAPPIPVKRNALWDGRFRLLDDLENGVCSAIGESTSIFRNVSNLPAAVLQGLPCIRFLNDSGAKPVLANVFFNPMAPVTGMPFPSL